MALRQNIKNLKLAMSDQNLELIPDYEQRIDVLKDLNFIDDNSTVLLKGRVACEVILNIFAKIVPKASAR
jgi:antiviral helicase SKI2